MASPKLVVSAEEIREIIQRLAAEIERDFHGQELVVLGVLKGAFIFMADLVRSLKMPLRCEFIRVSSYQSDGSQGDLRLEFDLTHPVRGKNVLILEDVVDTGKTLEFIRHHLEGQGAKVIKFCALVCKASAPVNLQIDYLGKMIPNGYVVGYGMDLDGLYRNWPGIEQVEVTNS